MKGCNPSGFGLLHRFSCRIGVRRCAIAKRDAALREAFRRALQPSPLRALCASVGPSGFGCQLDAHHDGQHLHEVAGVRRRWAEERP